MAEVGILVTVKDATRAAMKGLQKGATASLKSVRAVAEKAAGAFDTFGKVAQGVNQTLEIGRKAWEMLRVVVADNIAKALEFRKANDPVLKWFKDMKRDTDLLRAAIGDALIPVVQGLAEGFGLVGRGARDWIRENRKLIASGVLEWTIKLGTALIKGVAKATLLVVKAWKGWEQIILGVKMAGEQMFASVLAGTKKVIEGMADVVAVFDEGLAESMRDAASLAGDLGKEFELAGDKSYEALNKSVSEVKTYEKEIYSVANVALKKLATAHVVGQKIIKESYVGTNRTIEEQKKAIEDEAAAAAKLAEERAKRDIELAKKVDNFLKERHEARLERMTLEESLAIEADERISESVDTMRERATSLGEALGSVVQIFAEEQKKASDLMAEAQQAMADGAVDASEKMAAAHEAQADVAESAAKRTAVLVIDTVSAMVSAFAIEAAAAAFASMASIPPPLGPALGAAAAAAAGAAVMAIGTGLQSIVGMAAGGVVAGGTPGRDSVPAMLMPGEQVMSVGERRAMQVFMGRLLGAQAGQAAVGPATAGPGGRSVVVNQKTEVRTWVPGIVEETKMARRLETRAKKRLWQQGMLLEQKQAAKSGVVE